ncbi:c-type cytochrome [Azospirillum thermophilum]|uniref:Cytochrome C n=1 Tax=Azospirillum thermophilum TaxID=2202148 RepID=A0A2S2CWX3_9PROT|nr:cytochrome c [Azospirillum thermophilum]AWK88900.1 cytochrome C [Azospirillum thermophilum]
MTLRKAVAYAALAAGLLAAGTVSAQDPIAARKDGFKAAKEAMGMIKKTLDDGGDLAVVKTSADKLADVATKAGGLFPAGSDKGDTKAKPAIWSNMDDFKAKNAAFAAESAKLSQIAAAGDAAATKKQFGAVAGTCKACHDSYRSE